VKILAFLLMISLTGGAAFAQTPPAQSSEQKVIAVVLGKKIRVKDKARLNGLIFGTLLERFAQDNRIEPTEEELDTFIRKTGELKRRQQEEDDIKEMVIKKRKQLQAELQSGTLSVGERKTKESSLKKIDKDFRPDGTMREAAAEKVRLMKRRMALQFVRRWKINKALFAKYEGRVIFQQVGPEPLDAYRDFLREQEKKGAFKILDEKYKAPFWRYFTNDAMHSFYPDDEGAKFINTPWWMMDPPTME
jgi:hypothetical protein